MRGEEMRGDERRGKERGEGMRGERQELALVVSNGFLDCSIVVLRQSGRSGVLDRKLALAFWPRPTHHNLSMGK